MTQIPRKSVLTDTANSSGLTLQQRTLLFHFLLKQTLRRHRAAPQLRQLDRVQTDHEDEGRESREVSTNSNHSCAPLTASQ